MNIASVQKHLQRARGTQYALNEFTSYILKIEFSQEFPHLNRKNISPSMSPQVVRKEGSTSKAQPQAKDGETQTRKLKREQPPDDQSCKMSGKIYRAKKAEN